MAKIAQRRLSHSEITGILPNIYSRNYGTCHKKLYTICRFVATEICRSSAESSKDFRGIAEAFPQNLRRISVESTKDFRGIIKGYLRLWNCVNDNCGIVVLYS